MFKMQRSWIIEVHSKLLGGSNLVATYRFASHFTALRKGDKDFLFKSPLHEDLGDVPSPSLVLRKRQENFARHILNAQNDLGSIFGAKANAALTNIPFKDHRKERPVNT